MVDGHIACLESEVAKLKQEIDILKTQLATGTGGISNNYTVIEYDKLCELLKAQDELASLKGLKPFMN